MNRMTPLAFLFGSKPAILDVATSRGALWIGVLFTIAAGLAREYDGENLLHQPWHLLRPLGASLVSGTVLFLLMHTVMMRSFISQSPA